MTSFWWKWRLEEVAAMPHCAAFGCNYETKGKKTALLSE